MYPRSSCNWWLQELIPIFYECGVCIRVNIAFEPYKRLKCAKLYEDRATAITFSGANIIILFLETVAEADSISLSMRPAGQITDCLNFHAWPCSLTILAFMHSMSNLMDLRTWPLLGNLVGSVWNYRTRTEIIPQRERPNRDLMPLDQYRLNLIQPTGLCPSQLHATLG